MTEASAIKSVRAQKSGSSNREMTANSASRRAGTDAAAPARSKRNRYISLACNECRRRKIKCNGSSPCQRCGHLKLECLYAPNCCTTNFKDSEEFQAVVGKIERLDTQVQTLFANFSKMQPPEVAPSVSTGISFTRRQQTSRSMSESHTEESTSQIPLSQLVHPTSVDNTVPKRPRFHGPMSNDFTFDVAKSGLCDMGIVVSCTEKSNRAKENNGDAHLRRNTSTSTVRQLRKDSNVSIESSSLNYITLPRLNDPLQQEGSSPRLKRSQVSPPSLPYTVGSMPPPNLRATGIRQPTLQTHTQKPQQLPPFPELLYHPMRDPIHAFSRGEALRLCAVYDEEIGLLYPLLNNEQVIHQVHSIYNTFETTEGPWIAALHSSEREMLFNDDTCILKLVLAIALTVEGNGENALGSELFTCLKKNIHEKMADLAYLKNIQFLTLVAIYHFTTDDDVMAYRQIGIVSRMCLEMGLHSQEGISKAFPDSETDMRLATRVFWTIYTLDRRFSFGTGLPFSLQDADISVSEADYLEVYLKAMIPLYRIGSKLWYSGIGFKGDIGVNHDKIQSLDSELLDWAQTIPEELRANPYGSSQRRMNGVNRGHFRLHIITYIRANCMRMLIYRPVLHSTKSIVDNMTWAQRVVNIAKDTIRVLTQLNHSSDIYRTLQVMFNFFMISALGVLILAVSHAPSYFSALVRDEFDMALSLIRDFSQKSFVSKRLWKMICNLHEIGRQLGLVNSTDTEASGAKEMPANPSAYSRSSHPNPSSESTLNPATTPRSRSFDSGISGGVRPSSMASLESSASLPPDTANANDSHSNTALPIADLAGRSADPSPRYRPLDVHTTRADSTTAAKSTSDHVAKANRNSLNSTDVTRIGNELTNFFKVVGGQSGIQITSTSNNATASGASKGQEGIGGTAAARLTFSETGSSKAATISDADGSRCGFSEAGGSPGPGLSPMDLAWM